MLKSMGERTPPCGTPDLNCRSVDVWFLNVAYAMRPLMQFAMYPSMVCGIPRLLYTQAPKLTHMHIAYPAE